MKHRPPISLTNVDRSLPADVELEVSKLRTTFADEWAHFYIDNQKFRCFSDAKTISALAGDRPILNIGGAPYLFEVIFLGLGGRVVSVDLDVERHAKVIAELELDVIPIDIEDSEQRERLDLSPFDLVCMCEIFEHMRIDLIGMLKYIFASMRPRSKLYVTTPNFFYLPNVATRLWGGRSGPHLVGEWGKLARLGHMGHVREYSAREVREIFEHVGFTTQQITYRNSYEIEFAARSRRTQLAVRAMKRLAMARPGLAQEMVFLFEKP